MVCIISSFGLGILDIRIRIRYRRFLKLIIYVQTTQLISLGRILLNNKQRLPRNTTHPRKVSIPS
jgi:hypothetical protein